MEHFTQLNLQKEPQQKISQRSGSKQAQTHKAMALFGSLAVAALLTGFVAETGCTRDKAQTAIAAPSVSPMPASAPVSPVAAAPVPAKPLPRKTRQHTLATSSYANPSYGVAFRYPRKYSLQQGEQANLEWTGLGPVEMNFAKPGGTTLAAVTLPKSSFPGTDFSAGFFNVSAHSKITADECGKFLFPQTKASGGETVPVEPKQVKLGAAEFTQVEDSGGSPPMQADAKYYHVFQNGTCYEFMLGVETSSKKITDMPVNRNEVFRKLNWMLSTVKIEPAGVPDKTVPVVAKEAGTPAAESKN